MHVAQSFRRLSQYPFLIPLAIMLFSLVLTETRWMQQYPQLSVGITYDLTLVAPMLYLWAIWRKSIPKITVVPIFIIGLLATFQILPEDQWQQARWLQQVVLPVVELAVIGVIGYKVVKAIKVYQRLNATNQPDVYALLQQTAQQVVKRKRIAHILATELGMMYYGLLSWKKPAPSGDYTSYKTNGSTALLAVIIFLVLVETIVLHLVLLSWQPVVAWVIFALSLYTILQLFAHGKALRRRFTRIGPTAVHLANGLAADATIPLDMISAVNVNTNSIDTHGGQLRKVALLGDLEPHNVVFYLTSPIAIQQLYGLQKRGDVIACFVDEPAAFVEEITERLAELGYSGDTFTKG